MSGNITTFRHKLEQRKGAHTTLVDQCNSLTTKLDTFKSDRNNIERAQIIIQEVALETQENLRFRISSLISLAISSVFGEDAPKFDIQFEHKNNRVVAQLFLVDGEENQYDPLDDCGGGLADVCAFALQICFWSLQTPQSRNTLILDEPLKWLKGGDLPIKGAEMIKQLSTKLGLQIIMVSHSEELIDTADRVFEVTKNQKGVSLINQR